MTKPKHPGGRPRTHDLMRHFGTRLEEVDIKRLGEYAKAHGMTQADTLRAAIRMLPAK